MSEHFAADSTVGAIEIGALISIFLFGLVTVQTYTYVQRYPKDSLMLKLLVSANTPCVTRGAKLVFYRSVLYGAYIVYHIP